MTENRFALLIANDKYEDSSLRELIAPVQDVNGLASVLREPSIGDFSVQVLINKPSYLVKQDIEKFFRERQPQSIILLYFSGHGIKDQDGKLYFATPDTKLSVLLSTSIESSFINNLMHSTRAKQQILLIDCCYSGAFPRGMTVRSDKNIGTGEYFSDGRGRAIMTASDAIQYAFEGDSISGEGIQSVFTNTIIHGLKTGDADENLNGRVTFEDLYDYVAKRVKEKVPQQSPKKWLFNADGKIDIAYNPNFVLDSNDSVILKTFDWHGNNSISFIFLVLEEGEPVLLGTGRNSVTLLARTTKDPDSPRTEYRAIKFLKDDINQEYAAMSEERFLLDTYQISQLGRMQDYFIQFYGFGIIGDIKAESFKDFQFPFPRIDASNKQDKHLKIKKFYMLRGPFYVTEVSLGSLHDILEVTNSWLKSNRLYKAVDRFRRIFEERALYHKKQFNLIKKNYLLLAEELEIQSGYEILNAFKTNEVSNRIRNYAVLELFEKIVYVVSELHTSGLAHRDLKLGNLLLKSSVDPRGVERITFKLTDLGYVADVVNLARSNSIEIDNWRTPGALVLGSQYYRAPEQSRLPINVKVEIDNKNARAVIIKSSKVQQIEIGDWLVIDDYFSTAEQQELYQIIEIQRSTNFFELILDSDLNLPIDDFEAYVFKPVGYHTDGFSLGAILYDLVSGGKNPEDFYTYCLEKYQVLSRNNVYSIQQIINHLQSSNSLEGVLVKDVRGISIPNDILLIIAKCMLRNIDGAYYSSYSPAGFFGEGSVKATTIIYQDVLSLLEKPQYYLPEDFPWAWRANLLIKLKVYW